jgi:formylglycine-generating enzyme required for sulfatase activity
MWPQGSTAKDEWKESREVHSKLCNENFAGRDDHPVNCVTWAQARDYCAQAGGRLPSEAEWEFAARGADGRVYPWGDAQPDEKHMNGCGTECAKWREGEGLPGGPTLYAADDGFPGTSPVGSFALGATKWGIDDLVGNVFEWTADDYLPYATEGAAPPPEGAPKKVIRGGAFNSTMPQFADPALRFGQEPEAHTHGIGFRCAADPRTN